MNKSFRKLCKIFNFKPNIDDLRESPAMKIAKHLFAEMPDVKFNIVEPNISSHPDFDIVDFQTAFEQSDIVVYLTAHKQFFMLPQEAKHDVRCKLNFRNTLSQFLNKQKILFACIFAVHGF